MDRYTEKIKMRLLEQKVAFNEKLYFEKKQDIDTAINNLDTDDYNTLIKDILDKSKRVQSASLFDVVSNILIGIVLIFIFDYRTALFFNIVGWVLILYGILQGSIRSDTSKYNSKIDVLMTDPANFSGLKKELHKNLDNLKKSQTGVQSLQEKLQEIIKLLEKGIITEEEYKEKRKQIIEKHE